jgi:predicted transcriptional regulator
MSAIKISSKVEESAWKNLRELAKESNQSISGVLTEAIEDYLRRHRVRPEVMKYLEDSMNAHESLGQKLAQ